jgi:predicted AAA+ superfamily ATPase
VRNSPQFGSALEHWVLHELRAARSIRRTHWPIHFWRSTAGHEVDFCLGETTAIEVKATSRLAEKHFRGLMALKEEKVFKKYIMVSLDSSTRTWEGGIECWPAEEFFRALAQGAWD